MRRQDNVSGASAGSHLFEVDLAVAESIDGRECRFSLAPQGCLYSRGEFTRAEWLGDVIVRTELKQEDLVGNLGNRAEHNHRGRGCGTLEFLAEFSARDMRQDEIEHNRHRAQAEKHVKASLAIARYNDRVVLIEKHPPQDLLHAGVVLDYQDCSKAWNRRWRSRLTFNCFHGLHDDPSTILLARNFFKFCVVKKLQSNDKLRSSPYVANCVATGADCERAGAFPVFWAAKTEMRTTHQSGNRRSKGSASANPRTMTKRRRHVNTSFSAATRFTRSTR